MEIVAEVDDSKANSSGGGATSLAFIHDGGVPLHASVKGPPDRLEFSVVPHEVTHMVLAHHFRRPIARWADEGMAQLSEDANGQGWQEKYAGEGVENGMTIPLRELFTMRDYPRTQRAVLSFYADSWSVADFLVAKKGKPEFLAFVVDGMDNGWDGSVLTHYGYQGVNALETDWKACIFRKRQQPTRPPITAPPAVSVTVPPGAPGAPGASGPQGPTGPQGKAGENGKDADNSAVLAELRAMRAENNELRQDVAGLKSQVAALKAPPQPIKPAERERIERVRTTPVSP